MSGIKGWEKCTLLTKPEQSGKTFLMLQKIVEDFLLGDGLVIIVLFAEMSFVCVCVFVVFFFVFL